MSISKIVHSMPSRMPICEPMPSASNMRKNMTAQNGDPGNSTIACVKTMNARPVPSAACNTACHIGCYLVKRAKLMKLHSEIKYLTFSN